MIGWIAILMLVVASVSFWIGLRSVGPGSRATSGISTRLPEPRQGEPLEARALPHEGAPPISTTAPVERPSDNARAARPPAVGANEAVAEVQLRSSAASDRYPLWPSNMLVGAEGRLVRIGSFESASAAQNGWQKILVEYPGMARLSPVTVSGKSLRDGRTFYSLQLGTSSRAHSDVVCERSGGLNLKCNVVAPVVTESQ